MFLYQKTIDRSILRQGFQIPVEFHHLLKAMLEVIVESINNDTSNIIILSPSYHCIIHKAKPRFDRPSLSFHFPNGLVEKVKIERHLNVKKP